ncbi:hypothetical protein [Nonomuraea candida]|uniref:hypothetical protein n=1 Tax=Nonomuraea candida TaxID=359159 RepID=UPI000A883A53
MPEAHRDGDVFEVLAAYSRLLSDPDPAVRAKAARDWVAWEDAVISQEANGTPGAYGSQPDDALMAMTRICAHYFANAAWLEEGALLRDADRLAGIPGALIHGRLDLGSPLRTAWELAEVWPDATLRVIEDSGHTGSETLRKVLHEAIEAFSPAREG